MKKLEGVESVTVSLEKGNADIRLKAGNVVSLQQVRRAIRDSGFSPRQADVEAVGRAINWEGKPAFEVFQIGVVYLLAEDPEAKGALKRFAGEGGADKAFAVTGTIPDDDSSPAPLLLKSYRRAAAPRPE